MKWCNVRNAIITDKLLQINDCKYYKYVITDE